MARRLPPSPALHIASPASLRASSAPPRCPTPPVQEPEPPRPHLCLDAVSRRRSTPPSWPRRAANEFSTSSSCCPPLPQDRRPLSGRLTVEVHGRGGGPAPWLCPQAVDSVHHRWKKAARHPVQLKRQR